MPNFSKMMGNYPFHFIAGLGAVGAAAGGLSTRMRDRETSAGMGIRGIGRGIMGGAMLGGIGAAGVGAARYGTAYNRSGVDAASRLMRRDWNMGKNAAKEGWSGAKTFLKSLRGL